MFWSHAMISVKSLFVLLLWSQTSALEIDTSATSLLLQDSRTGISSKTLFIEETTDVVVENLSWSSETSLLDSEILSYATFVDGEKAYEGFIVLPENSFDLPTSMNVATISPSSRGKMTIRVDFRLGEQEKSVSTESQSFKKWLASFPMMVIFFLGLLTNVHLVYILLFGLLIGGSILNGSIIDGFNSIITKYILEAASKTLNIYTYIFTLSVAGFVAMIRKSGGIDAVAQKLEHYSNSMKVGPIIVFVAGIIFFFDATASVFFVGEFVSPFFGLFPNSVEKFAFLIDSTAVSVAAFNPLSTWFGFGTAIIQSEVDKLLELNNGEITIADDGWVVLSKSIQYQFYPIFVCILIPMLIAFNKDFGPMLIAERRRWLLKSSGQVAKCSLKEKISRPDKDTPRSTYNMWIPMFFLNVTVWTAVGAINEPDAEDNAADFMAALIYCVLGAALLTQLLYVLQSKLNGEIGFSPSHVIENLVNGQDNLENNINTFGSVLRRALSRDKKNSRAAHQMPVEPNAEVSKAGTEDTSKADHILKELQALSSLGSEDIAMTQPVFVGNARALVSLKEGAESFLKGAGAVTPMLMTLTLAWATTGLFLDLGVDRLFADLINIGNLSTELFPAVSFVTSFLLTVATGSSTATITIVLPLVAAPTYVNSGGDADLFYALIGAVFSGAAAGEHASPLATSSILSSFTTECGVKNHIFTQTPYILFVAFLSVVFGTIPSAYSHYPSYAAYLVGTLLLGLFVYFLCERVVHPEGRYDFITEKYLARVIDENLQGLKTQMRISYDIFMAKTNGKKEEEHGHETDCSSTGKPGSIKDEESTRREGVAIEISASRGILPIDPPMVKNIPTQSEKDILHNEDNEAIEAADTLIHPPGLFQNTLTEEDSGIEFDGSMDETHFSEEFEEATQCTGVGTRMLRWFALDDDDEHEHDDGVEIYGGPVETVSAEDMASEADMAMF